MCAPRDEVLWTNFWISLRNFYFREITTLYGKPVFTTLNYVMLRKSLLPVNKMYSLAEC